MTRAPKLDGRRVHGSLPLGPGEVSARCLTFAGPTRSAAGFLAGHAAARSVVGDGDGRRVMSPLFIRFSQTRRRSRNAGNEPVERFTVLSA